MFSLFKKEIPKACPNEGGGTGGARIDKKSTKGAFKERFPDMDFLGNVAFAPVGTGNKEKTKPSPDETSVQAPKVKTGKKVAIKKAQKRRKDKRAEKEDERQAISQKKPHEGFDRGKRVIQPESAPNAMFDEGYRPADVVGSSPAQADGSPYSNHLAKSENPLTKEGTPVLTTQQEISIRLREEGFDPQRVEWFINHAINPILGKRKNGSLDKDINRVIANFKKDPQHSKEHEEESEKKVESTSSEIRQNKTSKNTNASGHNKQFSDQGLKQARRNIEAMEWGQLSEADKTEMEEEAWQGGRILVQTKHRIKKGADTGKFEYVDTWKNKPTSNMQEKITTSSEKKEVAEGSNLEELKEYTQKVFDRVERYREKLGFGNGLVKTSPRHKALNAAFSMKMRAGKLATVLEKMKSKNESVADNQAPIDAAVKFISVQEDIITQVLTLSESELDTPEPTVEFLLKRRKEELQGLKESLKEFLIEYPESAGEPGMKVLQDSLGKVEALVEGDTVLGNSSVLWKIATEIDNLKAQLNFLNEVYSAPDQIADARQDLKARMEKPFAENDESLVQMSRELFDLLGENESNLETFGFHSAQVQETNNKYIDTLDRFNKKYEAVSQMVAQKKEEAEHLPQEQVQHNEYKESLMNMQSVLFDRFSLHEQTAYLTKEQLEYKETLELLSDTLLEVWGKFGVQSSEFAESYGKYIKAYNAFVSKTDLSYKTVLDKHMQEEAYENMSLKEKQNNTFNLISSDADLLRKQINKSDTLTQQQKQELLHKVNTMQSGPISLAGGPSITEANVAQSREQWKQSKEEVLMLLQKTESHEQESALLGMQIPKTGPGGISGVRSFEKALRLLEQRTLPELQKDQEKQKQYNEIIQIVSNVPDSGLTQEEVDRLAVLTQSIAMPESPLHLDTGRAIDQMYTEIEKNVHEKLPALAVKKKKRGFFGRLVRAAVLSLPLIGVASALHEKSPPQKVEAMTTAPTFDTTPTNSENTTNISASDVLDSEISRQIPSGPQAPELGSVASIPMTDVTEMMTSLDTTNDLQEGTQINNETIEKLKDYTVHKGDNLTFIIEGKTEGGIMLPALQAVPEAQREHILNHVITALRYSPEKQKEIGVQSGNVDLIYPGDVVSTEKLNTLITQVAKDQGINVVQQ